MPLFPQLRPYLEAVREELLSDPDFDPKATPMSRLPVITRYRDSNINSRTQLCKIITRAGLTPCPKLFQNLRATRAIEWADLFPAHVAADLLVHSSTIADKHYRQTTEAHFTRAIQEPDASDTTDDATGKSQQKAQQSALELAGTQKNGKKKSTGKTLFPVDCR